MSYLTKSTSKFDTLIIIVIAISVVFLILLIIALALLIRRYKIKAKLKGKEECVEYENTFANSSVKNMNLDIPNEKTITEITLEHPNDYATPKVVRNPKIGNPIEIKKIKSNFKENTLGLLKAEFKKLKENENASTSVAAMMENKEKNQYTNILPYDHSRVCLKPIDSDISSTYINASYIHGYKIDKEYIATQAPKKCTINDMWRMIWEQDINTIIMLTKLMETNVIQCIQYWPDQETLKAGEYIIKHLSTSEFSFYTERHFVIHFGDQSRRVIHLQYTRWPDDDIPNTCADFIEFIEKVNMYKEERTGPVLVHCSAGIGRTGTFIAIDYLRQQAQTEEMIDVLACVQSMRMDRKNMVKTVEQYQFIYNTLYEDVIIGKTTIKNNDFPTEMLDAMADTRHHKSRLEKQLNNMNLIYKIHESQDHTVILNKEKINNIQRVSGKDNFLYLSPIIGDSTSTFINATFSDSYKKTNDFILTQTPSTHSLEDDFWRMVTEHQISGVVSLDDKIYWPTKLNSPVSFNKSISVTLLSVKEDKKFKIFQCAIEDGRNNKRNITIWHVPGWKKEKDLETHQKELCEINDLVVTSRLRSQNKGPIVVQCFDGATYSGYFVALHCILSKMKIDQHVDVAYAVKKVRQSRRVAMTSYQHYRMLHDTVTGIIMSTDNELYHNTA